MDYQIPLFQLNFGEEEIQAVTETIRSKWISTGVLAEKAGFLAVIIGNGCFTMPDTPIVTVPVSSTGHLSLECERRRRPIEGSGCILPDHPG